METQGKAAEGESTVLDLRIGRKVEESSFFFFLTYFCGKRDGSLMPQGSYAMVHVCHGTMCTVVRGKPLRVDFLHLLCEFQGPNSGCQAWWQIP